MPKTDDEDDEGYFTAWGAENYPGWMERRFHEAWGQDWFWCKLCKKWMTDEHKDGVSHNKRLQWWLADKAQYDAGGEETPPRHNYGGGGSSAPRDGGGDSAPHGVTVKHKVQ